MTKTSRTYPSETYTSIRRQLEEARAQIDLLKGAELICDADLLDEPEWAVYLDHFERLIMGMLIAGYPRIVSSHTILHKLPRTRLHQQERNKDTIRVHVSHIRGKLGKTVIVSHIDGWSAGKEFMERIGYDHKQVAAGGNDLLASQSSGSDQRLVRDHA